MGTIVNLPAERRRRRPSEHHADEATILLFMGVRYVREIEASPVPEQPQRLALPLDEVPLAIA